MIKTVQLVILVMSPLEAKDSLFICRSGSLYSRGQRVSYAQDIACLQHDFGRIHKCTQCAIFSAQFIHVSLFLIWASCGLTHLAYCRGWCCRIQCWIALAIHLTLSSKSCILTPSSKARIDHSFKALVNFCFLKSDRLTILTCVLVHICIGCLKEGELTVLVFCGSLSPGVIQMCSSDASSSAALPPSMLLRRWGTI